MTSATVVTLYTAGYITCIKTEAAEPAYNLRCILIRVMIIR